MNDTGSGTSIYNISSSSTSSSDLSDYEHEGKPPKIFLVGSPFRHPWWVWGFHHGVGSAPRCLDEWLIMEISASIRSKPDWEQKYKDEEIVDKWKLEITEQCKDKTKYIEEVLEYVFKELEWYEKLETQYMGSSGFAIAFNDYISFSDSSIASNLKDKLKREVLELLESFGDDLDYHPGSDEKVIDLVHPSLYPLQYDITPILKHNNSVKIVKYKERINKAKKHVDFGVSKRFQWLPSLLKLYKGRFTFNSYINNLHPVKHKDLYNSIENIFNDIIPGLNYVFSKHASKEHLRIKIPPGDLAYSYEYHRKFNQLDGKWSDENLDEEELNKQYDELRDSKENYILDIVKPKWKVPPKLKHIDVKSFESLKVIVKLANIQLTPENPTYDGGKWHVEGTINEDIVATALYYYDMDNITESRLSFRSEFEDPEYEQHDWFYPEYFYGIVDEDVMVKNIGSIEAKEDRIVIFPNLYQHHVEPFELKDKTKPGYRKILCFFICDPYNTNVVATDKVPPQQEDWWNDEELNYLYPGNIKREIQEMKSKLGQEWPIKFENAESIRMQLMEERGLTRHSGLDLHEEEELRRICLCEH